MKKLATMTVPFFTFLLFLYLVSCYSILENQAEVVVNPATMDETRRLLAKWLIANKQLVSPTGEFHNVEFENLPLTVPKENLNLDLQQSSCQLVEIVHLLHHAGCQPKAIASYACSGFCSSYVQVSTSKFWQYERSCSCCQQTGLQEATFTLDCPSLDPPYKKIKTYAPVGCMCRACTDIGKENLQPRELIEALAGELSSIATNPKL